jgi:membrane-associated phospholipid phosphatase
MARGIRSIAWSLVAVGIAAPLARRKAKLPPAVVLGTAGLTPLALCAVVPRSRKRDAAVCLSNMWAYLAAYKMPNDDPQRLARRVHLDYPIAIDKVLGLGMVPTLRLQRTFSAPGSVNRFERLLVWCHWMWFFVPHVSVAYVLIRKREAFPGAAARMYGVFDTGGLFYWMIPTAPPWWAAEQGRLEDNHPVRVRRMMIEYGEEFWGDRWEALYDVLGGNPLAAMPSLHFATSLMAAHVLSDVDPVAGAVGWTYASLLGLALVYLGEHYAVDLLAGAALTESVRSQAPRLAPLARRISSLVQALEARAAAG